MRRRPRTERKCPLPSPEPASPFGLWEVFERSLWRHSDRPALHWGEQSWSYGELLDGVADRAWLLRRHGAGEGTRIMLLHSNGPGFVSADLAILAIGAVKIPVSSMLSAQELATITERVRPELAIVSEDCEPLVADLTGVAIVRVSHTRPPRGRRDEVSLRWRDARDLDAPRAIYFTGGTTGTPKGIVHSERGLLAQLWAQIIETGIVESDRLLLATPLVHAAGMFCQTALARGAEVRLLDKFDARGWLEVATADRSTWAFLVPTMIRRLTLQAQECGWRNTTVRTVQYGAAPISAEDLRAADGVFGSVFQQLYGQTECPNFVTALSKRDHADPARLNSAGRAATMADVAVLGPDGVPVTAGTVGEIAARSPYVMVGYWEDPDGYAERFSGGWLRTGDVGYLDADGYLFLVDRKNDMIVTGGLNVYSIEVESVLATHPAVAEVAVVGRPDSDWGEAVHAYVVLTGGADEVEATTALDGHARAQLAAYKRPKSIGIRDQLPLTRYGKIDKQSLRAELWAASGRSIG